MMMMMMIIIDSLADSAELEELISQLESVDHTMIVSLLLHKSSQQALVVVATHLYYHPMFQHLKAVQAAMLAWHVRALMQA
jgi:mRNA deadenylase 3'-5' endonuclease subunit Ccr4